MKLKKVIAAFAAAMIAIGTLTAAAGADGVNMYDYYCKGYSYITLNHDGWCFYGTESEAMFEGAGIALPSPDRDTSVLSLKTLIIPSEVNGIPVTGTHPNAFRKYDAYNCSPSHEKIYIPASVKTIMPSEPGWKKYGSPFMDCKSLTDVYYGGSETDWYNAMAFCGDITFDGNGNPSGSRWDGKFSKDSNWAYDGIENVTLHVNCKSIDDEGTIVNFNAKAEKPAKVSGIKRSGSKTYIKLSWNESKNAESYVIKYSTDKKTWKTKTVKANSVKLTKLKAGTKYYFKVAAKNSAGTSAYSKVFSVTTKK